MIRAYGGCIEPEGWGLAEEHTTEPCPVCSAPAHRWRCERAEGSLNTYAGLECSACGHVEGDRPNDID